ncbi:MAG: DNA alkylation repair protein [Acutalibacteraceae bacterium]
MDIEKIKNTLEEESEQKYREFSSRLINGSSLPLLGVRLPTLRKIAAEIHKGGNAEEFLEKCDFSSIEMSLLYSYVLGRMKGDINYLWGFFDRAAAYVDNWCTCDILCQSFKQCEKARDEVYKYLLTYIASGETYYMRIAVIMLMSHYLTDDYIDRVLDIINTAENDGYYYKMGAAWCIATALAKYPEKTFAFLKVCRLDDFTFNKAIQKSVESHRISKETKLKLKAMKRK